MNRHRIKDQRTIFDSLFLCLVVCLSALPYQFGLGFYADDWNTIAVLTQYRSSGPWVMLKQLLASDPDMLVRPLQSVPLVLGYEAFGRNATPYHLVNTAVIALLVVVLYLTIRELGQDRWLAFAIAIVFGLLPHYSTDKIWISSQQASVSLAFALLGIHAVLRWSRFDVRRGGLWLAAAAVSFSLSILAYEVCLGLIVAFLAWIAFRRFRQQGQKASRTKSIGGLVALFFLLVIVGLFKARMQHRIVYHHHLRHLLGRVGAMIWHAVSQAFLFNFWSYGLRMPAVLTRLYRFGAISTFSIVASILVFAAVGGYLWSERADLVIDTRAALRIAGLGIILFFLGYGLFINYLDYDFSAPGNANRVVIASALGVACVEVAACGFLTLLIKSNRTRRVVFGTAVAMICGANCLAMSGIGWCWQKAAKEQVAVLDSVEHNIPVLPHNSVLLLDGHCSYVGPAMVFDTDWDAASAIRLLTKDYTLYGDVISSNLRFEDKAVISPVPDEYERNYPYGEDLFVYNIARRVFRPLPDKAAADAYLRDFNPTGQGGCPPGKEGYGTKIF